LPFGWGVYGNSPALIAATVCRLSKVWRRFFEQLMPRLRFNLWGGGQKSFSDGQGAAVRGVLKSAYLLDIVIVLPPLFWVQEALCNVPFALPISAVTKPQTYNKALTAGKRCESLKL